MKSARRWFLFDAPANATRFEHWLRLINGRGEGLLIRSGPGLDPLLLASPVHAAGMHFGLSLHLRDQNQVALTSILQSALWLKIQHIFIGDPPPAPGIKPVGPSHTPGFITFARGITGDAIRYGVYNCLCHSRDEELLKANPDAGAKVIALPEASLHRYAGPGLEIWEWHVVHGGTTIPQSAPAGVQLLDFTHLPEPAVEPALKDWHERHAR